MAESRSRDMTILLVSLVLLVATLILTYTSEWFETFQGSWFVILGWFLLAAAVLTALAIKRSKTHGLLVFRNVTFVLGVLVMIISSVMSIWAHHAFQPMRDLLGLMGG